MTTRRIAASALSLALHLLALALAVRLAAGATFTFRDRPVSGNREVVVRKVVLPVVELPPPGQIAGLLPAVGGVAMAIVGADEASTDIALPGFTFDYRKVAGRAALLFPFLTPGLALGAFKLGSAEPPEARLLNPFAAPSAGAQLGRKPPLALAAPAMQRLIDRCWSRRERWRAFQPIADAIASHDPDAGRLPALVHAYLEQNGLQPYVDGRFRDPRLWAQLGLAADHADFVDFISRYAFEHPGTKTTTELLFLLDKLAQASLDALVALLDSDPIPDLGWTRQTNPAAFNAVVAIRHHYKRTLQRLAIVSDHDLRSYYDGVRTAILSGIVRTTPGGYRANDARFLLGAICWRNRDAAGAARWWRELTADPTDSYFAAYSEVEAALRATPSLETRLVNRILQAEHGRWISFSVDRLHQFGFHFDTF